VIKLNEDFKIEIKTTREVQPLVADDTISLLLFVDENGCA